MKIAPSEHVIYERNPLAEVVCQVRYSSAPELGSEVAGDVREELLKQGYTEESTEQVLNFKLSPAVLPDQQLPPSITKIFHFATSDGAWRFTYCSDFMALTCSRYSGWSEFLPRMLNGIAPLIRKLPALSVTRLGLRYKDVIEREPLGLEGTPWPELIQPFLLGPLMPNAFLEGGYVDEGDLASFLSQAVLQLEDCKLLLQSSLLSAEDGKRRAFLIDADFFNENSFEEGFLSDELRLKSRLESLHTNAGALFRRGITEKLHVALQPRTR